MVSKSLPFGTFDLTTGIRLSPQSKRKETLNKTSRQIVAKSWNIPFRGVGQSAIRSLKTD